MPENEYGNIEIFNGVPSKCVHLQEKGIKKACKVLGVEFKEAVIGFDRTKNWLIPIKEGIVCL